MLLSDDLESYTTSPQVLEPKDKKLCDKCYQCTKMVVSSSILDVALFPTYLKKGAILAINVYSLNSIHIDMHT